MNRFLTLNILLLSATHLCQAQTATSEQKPSPESYSIALDEISLAVVEQKNIFPGFKDAAQETQEETPCPNPKKLRGMCIMVGGKTDDSEPQGKYRYLYQRRLLEAACVDLEKDSEEEIGRKISEMWKQYEDILICNNTQFDVSNGSIIKYAVNMKFDVFIFELANWGVNFNKVDESDGRTVLDYVQDQIKRSKGLAIEAKLKQYYAALKEAGAKHKSEL